MKAANRLPAREELYCRMMKMRSGVSTAALVS
jgi:hypothetical protein